MRKTRTIVTGVALAAAFSLAACTSGSVQLHLQCF